MSLMDILGLGSGGGVFDLPHLFLPKVSNTLDLLEGMGVREEDLIDLSRFEGFEFRISDTRFVRLSHLGYGRLGGKQIFLKGTTMKIKHFRRHLKLLARELEMYRRLGPHPQLLDCYGIALDIEEAKGEEIVSCYLALKYLPNGVVWHQFNAKDPDLDPKTSKSFSLGALEVLGYVHERGVCHNDVKPQNFGLLEDRVVLFDFGISSLKRSPIKIPRGVRFGTATYAHPSQYKDGFVGVRQDLFSLGVTLYRMFVDRDGAGRALRKGDLNHGLIRSSNVDPRVKNLIVDLTNFDLSLGPQSAAEAMMYLQ